MGRNQKNQQRAFKRNTSGLCTLCLVTSIGLVLSACSSSSVGDHPLKAKINPDVNAVKVTASGGNDITLSTHPQYVSADELSWQLSGPGQLVSVSHGHKLNGNVGEQMIYVPPSFDYQQQNVPVKVTVRQLNPKSSAHLMGKEVIPADPYTFKLTLNPTIQSRFVAPGGVAYDASKKYLYITDIKTGRIRVLNAQCVVYSLSLHKHQKVTLVAPTGIAISPINGHLFVAESNRQIDELIPTNDPKVWQVNTIWQDQKDNIIVASGQNDHSNVTLEGKNSAQSSFSYGLDGLHLKITDQGDQKATLHVMLPELKHSALIAKGRTRLSDIQSISYDYDLVHSSQEAAQYRPDLKIEADNASPYIKSSRSHTRVPRGS